MFSSENINEKKVLALYDFASKQEYIYKTSKIKEISGASGLMSGAYVKFGEWLRAENIDFVDGKKSSFDMKSFASDAEVLYDGGGNLMVLYKNRDIYIRANRIISEKLLRYAPSLSLIACCVPVTGDFNADRKKLYEENRLRKSRFVPNEPIAVTPMTQIDPMTFRPVTKKTVSTTEGEMSLSQDRVSKRDAYKISDFDEFEGMTAVIYIDGNSMGNKLKSLASSSYDTGVTNLRIFSERVQQEFVCAPVKEIRKLKKTVVRNEKEITEPINFRQVIGGGDEITLICQAEDALKIVKAYFKSLENSKCVIPDSCMAALDEDEQRKFRENTACAGIAVVHSKSPFTVAYELAEAACESAKVRAHKTPGNYFDCYYCHAGATADFDTLREREQKFTGRPYEIDELENEFEDYAHTLRAAGRANVKALGVAAQFAQKENGEELYCPQFLFEIERVNAYLAPLRQREDEERKAGKYTGKYEIRTLVADDLRIIYDISEFYDLWFAKEENEK